MADVSSELTWEETQSLDWADGDTILKWENDDIEANGFSSPRPYKYSRDSS